MDEMTQASKAATARMDANTLKDLVDRIGLDGVLDALVAICREKAEYLRANWQDERAAREWNHAAKKVDRAAARTRFLAR